MAKTTGKKLTIQPPVRSAEEFIRAANQRPDTPEPSEQVTASAALPATVVAASVESAPVATAERVGPRPRRSGRNGAAARAAVKLPWHGEQVRADVIKSVNLRLDEPTLLKLKWLGEQSRRSQQEIIREALLPYLNAEIDKIVAEA